MSTGNKKHGRNKNRPAGKRYLAERRWEKNKRLKIAKHEKTALKAKAKAEKRHLTLRRKSGK